MKSMVSAADELNTIVYSEDDNSKSDPNNPVYQESQEEESSPPLSTFSPTVAILLERKRPITVDERFDFIREAVIESKWHTSRNPLVGTLQTLIPRPSYPEDVPTPERLSHSGEVMAEPPSTKEEKAMESPERLKARIQFLEYQLRSQSQLHLQLFTWGGIGFWVAALSLSVWVLTGISAPLHPTFAALVLPASIGLMIMAFLVRKEERKRGQ